MRGDGRHSIGCHIRDIAKRIGRPSRDDRPSGAAENRNLAVQRLDRAPRRVLRGGRARAAAPRHRATLPGDVLAGRSSGQDVLILGRRHLTSGLEHVDLVQDQTRRHQTARALAVTHVGILERVHREHAGEVLDTRDQRELVGTSERELDARASSARLNVVLETTTSAAARKRIAAGAGVAAW